MDSYNVYWCHWKEHVDPYTEGYVGVTKNLSKRYYEHLRNSNNLDDSFQKAINERGKDSIIMTILKSNISEDLAYSYERMYRPERNIGWNTGKGGSNKDSCTLGKEIILFHKDNPNIEYKFNSASEASEVLGIDSQRILQAKFRKTNIYGLDGWHVVNENTDKSTIKSVNEIRSESMKGRFLGHESWCKGKHIWSEEDKKRIGSFHKGKTISEEQKEITRTKNRLNHPTCSPITLVHIDNPTKEFTFHSISEASRQLNIPLPRLKSKVQRTLNVYGKDGWKVTKYESHKSLKSNDL